MTARGTILLVWCVHYRDGGESGSVSAPGRFPIYEDESYHMDTWMTRSHDRGQTWESVERLDPSPYDVIADNPTGAQVHDDAQDGQNRRCVYTDEGAEFFALCCCVGF